jgi:hypothetical protein
MKNFWNFADVRTCFTVRWAFSKFKCSALQRSLGSDRVCAASFLRRREQAAHWADQTGTAFAADQPLQSSGSAGLVLKNAHVPDQRLTQPPGLRMTKAAEPRRRGRRLLQGQYHEGHHRL